LRGGIAAHNQLLSHHLNLAGHSSTIFSYSLQYPSILFPGKTQLVEGNAGDLVNGLDILEQVNSINPINWYATGKKINALKPSLVILRFWTTHRRSFFDKLFFKKLRCLFSDVKIGWTRYSEDEK